VRIVDTHCHLDFPRFESDRESVIDEAKKAGVRAFLSKPVTTEKLASTIRKVLDKDSLDMTL